MARLPNGRPDRCRSGAAVADDTSGLASTTAWEALAVRLAARVIDLIIEPEAVAAGQIEEIMLSADVDGWPWLARLARSLQTAMLLATSPEPWRISGAAELMDDLERRGDRWTVCVTSLAMGVVYAELTNHRWPCVLFGGQRRSRLSSGRRSCEPGDT